MCPPPSHDNCPSAWAWTTAFTNPSALSPSPRHPSRCCTSSPSPGTFHLENLILSLMSLLSAITAPRTKMRVAQHDTRAYQHAQPRLPFPLTSSSPELRRSARSLLCPQCLPVPFVPGARSLQFLPPASSPSLRRLLLCGHSPVPRKAGPSSLYDTHNSVLITATFGF